LRLDCSIKVLLHTLQEYGHSPLWARRWVIRWLLWQKDFLHTPQRNGRSPICTRRCLFRCSFIEKPLLHTSQENGRLTLCKCKCFLRLLLWIKDFLHMLQGYGHSPLSTSGHLFKILWSLTDFLHTSCVCRRPLEYPRTDICMHSNWISKLLQGTLEKHPLLPYSFGVQLIFSLCSSLPNIACALDEGSVSSTAFTIWEETATVCYMDHTTEVGYNEHVQHINYTNIISQQLQSKASNELQGYQQTTSTASWRKPLRSD
jgi:hypothetical protein